MCSKMIFQKFRAFDYYPFISPLPKIKINRFLKISEREYIIKTQDDKYLNIYTSN